MEPRPNIVLIGLKHSGKSSLARLAAQEFGLAAVDLDDAVADLARAAFPDLAAVAENPACVRQLFKTRGKAAFQKLEAEAAAAAAASGGQIVATGGGAMENPAVAAAFAGAAALFLDAPRDALYQRIVRGGLPAFLDPQRPREHFYEIYEQRRRLAQAWADRTVDLDGKSLDQAYALVRIHIKECLNAR